MANVTAQVVERHMVRGLDKIFSPLDVNRLSDEDVLKVASASSVRRKRDFLRDRQQKLRSSKEILRDITGHVKQAHGGGAEHKCLEIAGGSYLKCRVALSADGSIGSAS